MLYINSYPCLAISKRLRPNFFVSCQSHRKANSWPSCIMSISHLPCFTAKIHIGIVNVNIMVAWMLRSPKFFFLQTKYALVSVPLFSIRNNFDSKFFSFSRFALLCCIFISPSYKCRNLCKTFHAYTVFYFLQPLLKCHTIKVLFIGIYKEDAKLHRIVYSIFSILRCYNRFFDL